MYGGLLANRDLFNILLCIENLAVENFVTFSIRLVSAIERAIDIECR